MNNQTTERGLYLQSVRAHNRHTTPTSFISQWIAPCLTPKKIAVIAGDGIGKEVMPEGLRALEAAAAKRFGLPLELHHL